MLLALDTSTLTASLALVEGTGPGARAAEAVELGPPRKLSEAFPQAIGELLTRHRLTVAGLEGLVIGLGPGSFTGLRIGLACVKGLAYAARRPVVGASSLAAAAMAGPPGVLWAATVARKGELYLGRYARTEQGLTALAPEEALTPAELAQALRGVPEARLLGPAVASARAELEAAGVPAERMLDVGAVPGALALARLVRLPPAYDEQALFSLEPHYVRASEAERNPKFPPLPGATPSARIKSNPETA